MDDGRMADGEMGGMDEGMKDGAVGFGLDGTGSLEGISGSLARCPGCRYPPSRWLFGLAFPTAYADDDDDARIFCLAL